MRNDLMIDKVTFIGSKHLGIKALETLCSIDSERITSVVTLDDSEDPRCQLSEIRALCQSRDLPLHVLTKPSQLSDVVRVEKPDLCLVVGWYWLVPPWLLKELQAGFLGIHASLLPKYRGGAPLVWPIINGETQSGISLFYFDEGMDTGDIVAQKKFDIGMDETIADILAKAEAAILETLGEFYPKLLSGAAPRNPQDHSQATYAAQRRPEDGRIDWSKSAERIHNEIRAQTRPYPGAFCHDQAGRQIRIWSSKRFDFDYYGTPGLVAETNGEEVIVTCGQGAVVLKEIQVETARAQPPGLVLRFGQRLK